MPATVETQAVEPLLKARACAARRKAKRVQSCAARRKANRVERDFLESGEYAALALMR